ncbi:branched-chain amino acid ABC transporter permease [Amnibacterium sp. CER49]|uniref:branched-chain amino acid ABC transporter permease n=1 Tax=Amnibacterium sp. CER49 TaxID=3039161 RepID=UPI00244C71CE|nr:branched-chain amino acid ABC transporter permease [Amnibacterium sp. CER49]MDH2443951.1 branched-chain amino acid ABC transporter permease [Amnibacterium sp. CER49]
MDFLTSLLTDFGQQILSSVTAAFAIAVIGLNLHFGYTGLVNIGQAGFMLIGGYGLAITVELGGGFFLGVAVGLVAAVLFALILGLPTLKLRGDYLAIVTIAAAEIIRIVGDNQSLSQWTGGAAGIPGRVYQGAFTALSPFPDQQLQIGPYNYPLTSGDSWFLRIVCWVVLAIVVLLVWLLMRSPWGRTVKGIREDEDAMRSLGKNVYLVKLQSLVLGGVIGAAGGMLYVLSSSVQADSLGRTTTFLLYTCLLLGGAATVFGPVLGSVLYFIVIIGLNDVVSQFVPKQIMNEQQIPQFGWIVVGIGLMLLVIFRPQGILGNKKELSFGD